MATAIDKTIDKTGTQTPSERRAAWRATIQRLAEYTAKVDDARATVKAAQTELTAAIAPIKEKFDREVALHLAIIDGRAAAVLEADAARRGLTETAPAAYHMKRAALEQGQRGIGLKIRRLEEVRMRATTAKSASTIDAEIEGLNHAKRDLQAELDALYQEMLLN